MKTETSPTLRLRRRGRAVISPANRLRLPVTGSSSRRRSTAMPRQATGRWNFNTSGLGSRLFRNRQRRKFRSSVGCCRRVLCDFRVSFCAGRRNRVQICFTLRQLHQKLLSRKHRRILYQLAGAEVSAVRLLQARLYRISQVSGQNFIANARQRSGIAHRKHYFTSLEQISRHPISRTDISFVAAAVSELINAWELEE